MWKPWLVSLLAATFAVAVSLLPERSEATDYLSTAGILALQIFSLTFIGLRLSRRANLPKVAAVVLALLIACIGFLESLPIKTHAVLMDMPSASSPQWEAVLPILLVIGLLISPAVFAFAAGRAFGAPPNNSLERSRER